MIAVKIKDADMALGQPDNWSASDGEVGVLFARRAMYGTAPAMLSAWKPSVDELEMLMRGGSIVLGIIGSEHPPVLMYASAED